MDHYDLIMIARFFYFFIFLFTSLLLPWWLTFIVGAIGMLLFPLYFEALFIGVLLDALYNGGSVFLFSSIPFFYSLSFLLLFAFFEFFKSKVQYFSKV
jgi:hypothetical protein